MLLPHYVHYVQSIRIDAFFPENRLYILGFDSHDVHSKFMKNLKISKKNFEILGDALFEHDDQFTILKVG